MTLTIAAPYDLTITNGPTTLGLLLASAPDGRKLWKKDLAPGLAPVVQASGAISYASLPANQEVVGDLSDWSRGFGAYDHAPGYYQYADHVDCSWRGMALPGPFIETTAKNPAGALDGAIVRTVLHGGVLFAAAGRRVYAWDGSNWTEKDNCGATITDLASYNGTLLAALGSLTAYRYSTDGGATWNTSILADPYATYFAVVQATAASALLWKAKDPTSLASASDPTNAGAWTVGPTVGDSGAAFTGLHATAGGGGVLLIGKATHLYRMDTAGMVSLAAGPYRPATGAGLPNFAGATELAGRVYYPVEDYGLIEYDPADGSVTTGMAPRDFGPTVSMAQAAITALTTDGEWLYLALAGATGFLFKGRYGSLSPLVGERAGERGNNRGRGIGGWVWHGAFIRTGIAVTSLWVSDDSSIRYLWMGNAASDYTPRRARLARGNPLDDTNARYAYSGELYLGRYAANLREVTKVVRRLTLQTQNLDAASSRELGVLWTADEGAEHTAVLVSASPESALDFRFTVDAVNAGLTAYNRLQVHLGFLSGATGGVAYTVPPVLRGVFLRSLVRPVRRWRFEFTVRLGDLAALVGGATDIGQTRRSLLALLEQAARQAEPVKLTDRDGAVWWMVVDAYEEVELKDHVQGKAGRFESAVRIVAHWVPDAVDMPE